MAGRLPRRAAVLLTTAGSILVAMLALANAASATIFIPGLFGVPPVQAGANWIATTPATNPLDPSCSQGPSTTVTEYLQLPNGGRPFAARLLDGSGKAYSQSNPPCGAASSYTLGAVVDPATPPGNPPIEGPGFHWASFPFTVGQIQAAFAGATPAIQPQINFNYVKCRDVTPTAPVVRAEGLTELLGNVVLDCAGGQPLAAGQQAPITDVTLAVSRIITSRLLAAPSFGEPLALIDDPAQSQQRLCVPPAPGGTCTVTRGFSSSPNVYQGVVNNNSVRIFGIPIDPPAVSGQPRRIRVTNIRAKAFGLSSPITASISLSDPLLPPVTTQPVLGYIQQGLSMTARNPDGSAPFTPPALQQCRAAGQTLDPILRLSEGFAGAFKPRSTSSDPAAPPPDQAVPGFAYGTESGFVNSAFPTIPGQGDVGTAGVADFGTRVQLRVDNLTGPAQVLIPQTVTSPNGAEAVRVSDDPAARFAPYQPIAGLPAGLGQMNLSGGSGVAVYEVVKGAPTPDAFDIPIHLSFFGQPAPGTGTITAGFGPASSVDTASATAPLPRFGAATSTTPLFSVAACPPPQPAVSAVTSLITSSLGGAVPPLGSSVQLPTSTISFVPGRRIAIVLSNGAPYGVAGSAQLELGARAARRVAAAARKKRRPTILARGSFALSPDATGRVQLALTKAGRRLLRRRQRALLVLTVTGNGQTVTIDRLVTLKPAGRRRR